MKFLVTGATGFIGRALCRRLAAEGGSLTPLSLSGESVSENISSLPLDLTAGLPDENLLDGVHTVIHLAGIAHRKSPPVAHEALNHVATVRLAKQAALAGVKRFIYLSSVKAMGEPVGGEIRSEADCVTPSEPYGLSKWRAEQGLRGLFTDQPMSVIIVRPALVYGAGVKGNLQLLSRAIGWGLPRPPAAGERSMIALDDLVELLQQTAFHAPDGLHTWIACGDRHYSMRAVYDLMRDAQGLETGHGWLPGWGWHAGAGVLDMLARRPPGTTCAQLFSSECYANAAAKRALYWLPSRSLEQLVGRIVSQGES